MFVFFFFKQKTAYEMRISDWSSDVCSSDLLDQFHAPAVPCPFEDEVISRPEKDEPDEKTDRRDRNGVEHSRPGRHRHDVAIADRRDSDHREIEHVAKADRKSTRLNSSH